MWTRNHAPIGIKSSHRALNDFFLPAAIILATQTSSSLQSHVLVELPETRMLLAFGIEGQAQQAEVVTHYEIPLLELIKHLQFLDFGPLRLINALVITTIWTGLHTCHRVAFSLLESGIDIPLLLVL